MDNIINECIEKFIKKEVIMEYNANNNPLVLNDIHNLLSLLSKFRGELIDDIETRHNNGENVSKNEYIIKRTLIDINELINDLKHLI